MGRCEAVGYDGEREIENNEADEGVLIDEDQHACRFASIQHILLQSLVAICICTQCEQK